LRHKSYIELCSVIQENGHEFHKDFHTWLYPNMHVFNYIVEQADLVYSKGRKYYAIATLWEVARHHSAIREWDAEFKLSNTWRTDVARLMSYTYLRFDGFFALRKRTGKKLGCYPWGEPL